MEELEEEETNNPEQINSAVKSNDDVKDELKRNASSIATAAGILAGGCTETTFLKDDVPGDDNKRDPERENWPCRVMLPILPIQSISGSRLLLSPGTFSDHCTSNK